MAGGRRKWRKTKTQSVDLSRGLLAEDWSIGKITGIAQTFSRPGASSGADDEMSAGPLMTSI